MKKFFSILFVFLGILTLTACLSNQATGERSSDKSESLDVLSINGAWMEKDSTTPSFEIIDDSLRLANDNTWYAYEWKGDTMQINVGGWPYAIKVIDFAADSMVILNLGNNKQTTLYKRK